MSRIVVGVDGSPGSMQALRWAVDRAEATGGTVRAIISWEYPPLAILPVPFGYLVPPTEAMDAASATSLSTYVAEIGPTTVPIEEVVGRGSAAVVLLRHAAWADLLVVGTRGRSRLAAVLLGSVSRKVAAAAPCPVVVVPETEADSSDPVVVAVDGSAGSLAALRWAAAATSGPIRVVHAYEHPFGPEYEVPDFVWADPAEFGSKLAERCVADVLGDRPDVTIDVRCGDPRTVLIEAGGDASMIVMGARGATGFEGWLVGSVTVGVASHAPVPVVIVPPDPS